MQAAGRVLALCGAAGLCPQHGLCMIPHAPGTGCTGKPPEMQAGWKRAGARGHGALGNPAVPSAVRLVGEEKPVPKILAASAASGCHSGGMEGVETMRMPGQCGRAGVCAGQGLPSASAGP